MVEAQLKAMEIKRHELEATTKRRCAIMDKATLVEKGICIPDPERFTWV
jgi:hypothetical protein